MGAQMSRIDPLPEAVKSADKLLEQLGDRPFNGEKFRLVLDIPAEYASLAAWLYYADNYHQDHSERFPFGEVLVTEPPVHAHRHAARYTFRVAISHWFAGQHKSLQQSAHPVLFPRKPLDDDIPW